jgi:predicted ATPase
MRCQQAFASEDMASIKSIEIHGFRSLKSINVELQNLNVLIGANGSGKSNFIAFFKMLNEMMAERLRLYIAQNGRATSLLHFGPAKTPQLRASIVFTEEDRTNCYSLRMAHAAEDTLLFTEESLSYTREGHPDASKEPLQLGVGHLETRLHQVAEAGNKTAQVFRSLLNQCRVYHFHDTSATSRMRQYCNITDNRWLRHDGGNLAAVLYAYQIAHPKAFRRIVSFIKQILPEFDSFVLEADNANPNLITLNWRMRNQDYIMGSHQLSDGTLRAIALATLLLQPQEFLPKVIVLDEPELGLHPYALSLVAGMIRAASESCQVIVATQSQTFLNDFEPSEIITTNYKNGETQLKRLNTKDFQDWLDEYTVGELWQRNVIAGGPLP